jgi:hypoxanthine-guanine phosphoribosyltransferase
MVEDGSKLTDKIFINRMKIKPPARRAAEWCASGYEDDNVYVIEIIGK